MITDYSCWCPEARKDFKLEMALHQAALSGNMLLFATFSS